MHWWLNKTSVWSPSQTDLCYLLWTLCLCTSIQCPIGGAGYGWISWYWQRFATSLPANPEAAWGGQEVSTPVPFPFQTVYHVCGKRRRGTGLLFCQRQLLKSTCTTESSTIQLPACVLFQLQMSDAMDNLEELLRLSGGEGQIFTVDGPLCMKSVQAMFGYNSAQPVYKQLFIFTFSMLTEEHLSILCLLLSLGSWLTMLTRLSMLSCTVGTCRQMFRSFLVLSLLWLMRRLSPYPEQSAQVPSRLWMYWSTAQLYHFLK